MPPDASQPAHVIHVGTSGWSYDDWHGPFYPEKVPARFDRLAYMARFFDCVEVNASFYRPPSPKAAASWLRRTPEDFTFAFKLHQRFTHERQTPWTPAERDAFRRGIDPVRDAGRLGAVLVQFPWSFRCNASARVHLEAIRGDFGNLPLVVEVRHASWADESAVAFLRDRGLGWANIDQPRSRGGVPPTSIVTSPVGYVRLHGRNREAWFDPKAGRDARYDYLYREDELEEWIDRIRDVARRSEKTFVFTNNHYRGQAPANALQILSRLAGRKVPVPSPLLRTYPFLERVAEDGLPPGEQGTLF